MEKLPLELVLQIFSHLPITDTWRLRCVARSWQHSLTSVSAIKNAIVRHESHDPGDSASSPAQVTSTDDDVKRQQLLQQERLLRNHYLASPLPSYSFTHQNEGRDDEYITSLALKGKHFAMTVRRGRYHRVHIRNLTVNKDFIIYADPYNSGNPIRKMCLTEDLVAFCNPQTLFTMRFTELNRNPNYNFARRNRQDANFRTIDMTGHKEKIVVLWEPPPPAALNQLRLVIYEHGLDRTQHLLFSKEELRVDDPARNWIHKLLIDVEAQVYHLFSAGDSDAEDMALGENVEYLLNHAVISTEGELISQRQHYYYAKKAWSRDMGGDSEIARLVSVGIPHVYLFCVSSRDAVKQRPTHHLLLNLERYDEVRIQVCTPPRGTCFAVWKGLSVRSELPYERLTFARLPADLAQKGLNIASLGQYKTDEERGIVLVNDSFIVWVETERKEYPTVHVLVFDERIAAKTIRPIMEVDARDLEPLPRRTVLWTHRSVKA